MVIFKTTLGRWRFTFTMAPIARVVGVNSMLPDGNHILMWDFDDKPLSKVERSLLLVQEYYTLPRIYILETKANKNYIAYCFKRTEWREAVEIIASTPNIDWPFFKYGVFRERFTLRVTPKCGRRPKLVHVLPSPYPEDASIDDLKSWVRYDTLPDGWETEIHELRIPAHFEGKGV